MKLATEGRENITIWDIISVLLEIICYRMFPIISGGDALAVTKGDGTLSTAANSGGKAELAGRLTLRNRLCFTKGKIIMSMAEIINSKKQFATLT